MLAGVCPPGRHTGAQLGHSKSNTLNEEPTNQPAPNHAASSGIPEPKGQSTGDAGQQAQDSEGDAERGPEREFPLELLLVTQGDQCRLVGAYFLAGRDVAIRHDRDHGSLAQIMVFHLRVRTLVALDLGEPGVHRNWLMD